MKTLLTSFSTAALLGFASRLGGRAFDGADFTAILFATGLVAWTIEQYRREPRMLSVDRPIRFPARLQGSHAEDPAARQAA